MNKKIALAIIFIIAAATLWAHTPLLYVEDNYDGTITVEGGFSNGAAIAGLSLMIVDAADYDGPDKTVNGKRLLFETKFDDSGIAELIKPAVEKYIVIFNGGPGHSVSIVGPSLEEDEKEDWMATINSTDLGEWKPFITGKK